MGEPNKDGVNDHFFVSDSLMFFYAFVVRLFEFFSYGFDDFGQRGRRRFDLRAMDERQRPNDLVA